MTPDKPIRHCKNCDESIKWVPYMTQSETHRGFWVHTDNNERRCAMVATPIPMDEHGIEYM